MNYIKLINAFYDRLETNSLSTSAIALWHALVHVNNKAGWPEEFTVAVSVLCVKTGLSERTISNARNDLKVAGYIDFRSRRGNKAAIYRVLDLSATITGKHSDEHTLSATDADSSSDNVSGKRSGSVSDNASALLNKTKQNETNDDEERASINPFQFYEQEGFGTLSSFTGEQLGGLIDDFGEEKVLEAMKVTRLNGSRSLNYTKKVLTDPKPQAKPGQNTLRQRGKVTSLFEASPETLERQKRDVERYAGIEIDVTDLPY